MSERPVITPEIAARLWDAILKTLQEMAANAQQKAS